jgi:hypothetical protein
MSSCNLFHPARLRRIVIATALMSAVALGQSGIASADREWDIEQYDDCLQNTSKSTDLCCIESGGDFGPQPNTCQAPPAKQQDDSHQVPTKQIPSKVMVPPAPAQIG